MKINASTWIRWARPFANARRTEWLNAMDAELSHIHNETERNRFAFGCFTSILSSAARSRKGLNYMARGAGAVGILTISLAGVWMAMRMDVPSTASLAPYFIIGLCMFYMGAAGLLLTSLRHLQTYAKFGSKLAIAGWLYGAFASTMTAPLPLSFVQAICIEMAAFMMGLYCLTIWLGWLYTPGACDEC